MTEQKEMREHILEWLQQKPEQHERLFQEARRLRERHFGTRVFLYGFLYAGTFCRNDCVFCQFRRSNPAAERYRKPLPQLLAAARCLAGDGVHLLDLTLGEDAYFINEEGFPRLLEMVRALYRETGLPLMVSPGVLAPRQLEALREAGASWYACYQETHAQPLFARLRKGQSFAVRRQARVYAGEHGLAAEDGLLACVGETPEELADSILAMTREPLRQVRVMGYVPHPATLQLAEACPPARRLERECLIIAILRLLMPERLIPASLDVDGLEGLAARLNAGANVVTSIVPSEGGFAGVASDKDIENRRRSVAAVQEILHVLGLEPATPEEYRRWLRNGAAQ